MRIYTSCVKDWYFTPSDSVSCFLNLGSRVTSVSDVQLRATADGKRELSVDVLPRLFIRCWCLSHSRFASIMLISLPVPPLPEKRYILTKDLDQFVADLKSADDEAAVIRRYRDILDKRIEVCCAFRQILISSGSRSTRKFVRALEALKETTKAIRKVEITVAQDKRVDQ